MQISLRNIILVIGLLCSISSFSQNEEYESVEQLANDIHSRRYEKPIAYMKKQIASMESDTISNFQDTIYLSLTGLLAVAYVHSDQIYLADSLLSHSINFFIKTGKTSPFAYSLYVAYGGLLSQLQNYRKARNYLEVAARQLREREEIGEELSIVLSMLSVCYLNLGDGEYAAELIEEAIRIIEKSDGVFTLSNKIGIYQKAGSIYKGIKELDKSEQYTKRAYELSKDKESFVSEFINAAISLATIYLNQSKYNDALHILKQVEKYPLSGIEKEEVYNRLFLAYYFLNNEAQSTFYVDLCSQIIRENSIIFSSTFPTNTIEDYWEKSAMQLKINIGLLDKFPSNSQLIEMCYDNLLFVKNLIFLQMNNLRNISKNDNKVKSSLINLQRLKSERLNGNISLYQEINEQEKVLISQTRTSEFGNSVIPKSWKDVQAALSSGEYAIEFFTYSGFQESDEDCKKLRYGALLLGGNNKSPLFVELCTFEQLQETLIKSIVEQEMGINQLYQRGGENILYNLIWKNIEPFVKDAKTIYAASCLSLLHINMGYIPCPDKRYINEKYDLRIVSSTSIVCNEHPSMAFSDIAIYGGVDYSFRSHDSVAINNSYRELVRSDLSNNTRGTYSYLHASEVEADTIFDIMIGHSIHPILYKGRKADEESFRNLDGISPSIIHMATHAFYLVGFEKHKDYFDLLIPYSEKERSMLYSGILLADANTTFNNPKDGKSYNDGILTAEEISFMDLSNTKLVVLSACESAIGTSMQEDIGGMFKAFKCAGVQYIIGSLWKVPDEATAKLMIAFYKHLASGEEIHNALKKAQQEVSRLYPDPYYWAAFILLE